MIASIYRKINRYLNPSPKEELSGYPLSRKFGLDRGCPIDRYYIENFLSGQSKVISGVVMEISEDTYTKRFGSDVEESLVFSVDQDHGGIHGDLTDINSLQDSQVDCFIATQTFNFIYQVEDALRGAYRLLKPGGVLVATVSSIGQISRYDMDRWGDFWRFTPKSIECLISEIFDKYEIKTYGNCFAAVSALRGLSVEDVGNNDYLDVNDEDYPVIIGFIATKTK